MQINAVNTTHRSDYHVVPMQGSWAIKGEANPHYTGIFETQIEATSYAMTLAREAATSVVIHGRNGQIREVWSYDHHLNTTNREHM